MKRTYGGLSGDDSGNWDLGAQITLCISVKFLGCYDRVGECLCFLKIHANNFKVKCPDVCSLASDERDGGKEREREA